MLCPESPPGRVAYSAPLVLYVGAVVVLALVLAVRLVSVPDDAPGVTLVGIAIFVMALLSPRIGVEMTVSATSFLHLGLAITMGPVGALVASVPEALGCALRFRSGWFRGLFNWSNNLVSGIVAWAAYHAIVPSGVRPTSLAGRLPSDQRSSPSLRGDGVRRGR